MVISNVRRDPNNSYSFSLVTSCASSIIITFMSNFPGRECSTFCTTLDSSIYSLRLNDSLAIPRTLSLYSVIDSSSDIFKALKFEVTNCNLDVLTFVVPSYATFKIFHTSLAELQELINLNTFRSSLLKIPLIALDF